MTAKKAAAAKKDDGTTAVRLVGASYGAQHDDERQVDTQLAESLVARGLARYPDEA